MAGTKPIIILGIDPQPTLLAVHIRTNNNTIAWFTHYLRKKARFENAQAWQEHVIDEVKTVLLVKAVEFIKASTTFIRNNYSSNQSNNNYYPTLVVCEQQKGRVNSIIEQSVLMACRDCGIKIKILHPTSWKKLTGVPCKKNNKLNKKAVEEMVKPKLIEYFDSKGMTVPARAHDLCDAEKLSEAGSIILGERKAEE